MIHIARCLFSTQAIPKGGTLFTWGKTVEGLGRPDKNKTTPQPLQAFQNQVTKAVMGPSHSAFITTSGDLYTFGEGKDGQLGHNDHGKGHVAPKMVQFFHKNNLKVVDVVCGERHTVVLTHDGDVWSFGWGGRKLNPFLRIFISAVSPLGHGDNHSHHTPTPVEQLRKHAKVTCVSAGRSFSTVINKKGEVYNWGRGEYGVFGNGQNSNFSIPTKNSYLEYFKQQNGVSVKSIKSAASYSLALMSDNKLYGWGSNDAGQIGVQSQIGVEMYETVNFATEITNQQIKTKKVVDFDVGENVVVFKLDDGSVWWSGMKLVFRPQKILIKSQFPVGAIGACRNGLAVAAGDQIHTKNDFATIKKQDLKTGVKTIKVEDLFKMKGTVTSLGGTYGNKFAIIQAP